MKKNSPSPKLVSSPHYVLGIEGGGTRTTWALLNAAGKIVERGEAGPGNVLILDEPNFKKLLKTIAAQMHAGSTVTAIGATFAGCQRDEEKKWVARAIQKQWPHARVVVAEDTRSALVAAHGPADGISVIAGTGSNVVAQKKGVLYKAGGWGHLFSDHGSGYDLARRGLESVYAHYDQTQKVTPLGRAFLRVTAQNSLEDLVGWMIRHSDKSGVAALAPCVFTAAQAGDDLAKSVLRQGAEELARRVTFLARRLKWRKVSVGLCGGLFTKSAVYAKLLAGAIRRELPGSRIAVVKISGAEAAAALAGLPYSGELNTQRFVPPSTVSSPTPVSIARSMTEQRNPRSRGLQKRSIQGVVDLFIAEENYVQRALRHERKSIAAACSVVSTALKKGGRLIYVGAGTSGRLGVVDASEMPPTFSAPPEQVQAIIAGGEAAVFKSQEGAEDDAVGGARSVAQRAQRGDVVCGIAASGQTPFVHGALREARRLGCKTILITCNPNRPSCDYLDVAIDLPTGPEIVTGSTRLKAGTVTKLVLNMLSTIAMIRLGRVYDNLMIDVQASNAKLRLRAQRLVSTILGLNGDEAEHMLRENHWSVREVVENQKSE